MVGDSLKTLHFLVLWPIYFLKQKVWKLFKCTHCLLCIDIWFSIQLTHSLSLFHSHSLLCRYLSMILLLLFCVPIPKGGIHQLHSIKVFLFYGRAAESLWLYHVETLVYAGKQFFYKSLDSCAWAKKSFQILSDGAFTGKWWSRWAVSTDRNTLSGRWKTRSNNL